MATRDYAKQGRPQPRRQSSQATEHARPHRGLWAALTFVLLAIGGFGYFLYGINGAADKAETAINNPVPSRTEPRSLPPKPVPKWQYEQQLRDKEVVVDVPEQPESTQRYRLQCGSFRSRAQAEELKARIAFQGLESMLKLVSGKNGSWYQVRLGPFDRKRQAEKTRHKLARARINYCKIYFWQN